MQIKIVSLKGGKAGEVELSPDLFSVEPRLDIISEVIRWQLAARQAGTHQVKNRSAVHGTTKKAFKQKGTGRARRGSWTSNVCRGGGVAFGPVVRSHAFKLNKKVRQLALKSALSLRLQQNNLVVMGDLESSSCKAKEVKQNLAKLGITSALFVCGEAGSISNFSNAIMNLPEADLMSVKGLNVYDVISKDKLVLTKDALLGLQKRLGGENAKPV
ncbi:MAG: 50S ribosomal protein L4 [Holosporales bacterium]|jgi:large subunit ribosomal protein L4|nr:50S ribosomal protein L4 [Holosporales bacterium]